MNEAHQSEEKEVPQYTEEQVNERELQWRTARLCHEANRAYCFSIGDESQPEWNDAPAWQKESAFKGVLFAWKGGKTPEESHISWLAEKERDGWKYGAVKDPEKKEHPCFVPYDQLPKDQQKKDHIFTAIVRAMSPH